MGYRKLTLAERILGVAVTGDKDGRIADYPAQPQQVAKANFNVSEIENGYLITYTGRDDSNFNHVQETYFYPDLATLGEGIVGIKAKHKILDKPQVLTGNQGAYASANVAAAAPSPVGP